MSVLDGEGKMEKPEMSTSSNHFFGQSDEEAPLTS
jgi:hypothetical protein